MNDFKDITKFQAWIMALRPKTLPAALAPVAVGTAVAVTDNSFNFFPAFAALLGALLLQIAVNLANDYFDSKSGVDTKERLGPVRVTSAGLIKPAQVKMGMILSIILALIVGIYLIYIGGWPILVIGVASIISALSYSGGPFPLASNGLGDIFVFIFFGLIAVMGTYYVQALTLTSFVFISSLPVGFLITAIIVINNLRDIETDKKAGKKTLAVMIGKKGSRLEYLLLLTFSYIILFCLWISGQCSPVILLPVITLPMAYSVTKTVLNETGPVLNEALAKTAKLSLIYSLLFSAGIIFS
ncbi:MAG: 1,4-dihydroxy-2-naphthoate polyprenyltransferase [bacterium]|nr:1,4-dihydroxy-2-naphthoate polyprenyltransferase [bacterium]